MSKQPDNANSDPRVSHAYREIADERTPDHLDDKIMRMAAKASRTPYAAARAWMRPVAWAATIGLSLAIVLELTLLPQESLQYEAAPPDPATSDLHQPDLAEPGEAAAGSDGTGTITTKKPLAGEWRAREMPSKAVPAPAMLDEDFRGDVGADVPRSEIAVEAGARRSMPVPAGLQSIAPQFLCPADVRDSADRWYDCIESLRDTVPESRIAAELEKFFAAHPDFVAPDE
ncbi:MAG: hypothetical protein KJN77_01245 [Gammaproteobacteria bacterium]|nr:hypothetical protein [Gammaproteobacteria bacterium]